MNCGCTCGCTTCTTPNKHTLCDTEEERQERIKASKRRYYQRNKEKHLEYKHQYDRKKLSFQQVLVTTQTNNTQQFVLKIVLPTSQQPQPQQIQV